jgi:hypothetical protein
MGGTARSMAGGTRDPSNGSRIRIRALVAGRTTPTVLSRNRIPFHQFTGRGAEPGDAGDAGETGQRVRRPGRADGRSPSSPAGLQKTTTHPETTNIHPRWQNLQEVDPGP